MSYGDINLDVQGRVGGEVKFKTSTSGVSMASFRLASTPRYFDKAAGGWSDRPTTWLTVECWRTLAENVHASVTMGQPVLVSGRLRTSEWIENGETRTRTVLDAFSVGHDLSRGTAEFSKNPPRQNQQPDSLRNEMNELAQAAESEELNPFHHDDNGVPIGVFASGPLVGDAAEPERVEERAA